MISIPNKYHVLDQNYKYVGTVIAMKSLEQAMAKAKSLILSKRSLACPHPVLVPDSKYVEFGDAIFSSPFGKADVPSTELQYTPRKETSSDKTHKLGQHIHTTVDRKPNKMARKKTGRQSMGHLSSE